MADTGIEWTRGDDGTPGKVWNPVRGCSLVSHGCTNCYAMKQAHRFSGPGQPYEGLTRSGANGPIWTGKVREVPEKLAEPLGWRKPARIFVNSMSDLFHEDVSFSFIDRVFAVMADCPRHTFQVLTKCPRRMTEYFADRSLADVYTEILAAEADEPIGSGSPHSHLRGMLRVIDSWKIRGDYRDSTSRFDPPAHWPLPNVWLGVSVEDQSTADARIPVLLTTPAAVRFISAEPLLGPVDLDAREFLCATWRKGITIGTYLDWVIVGGESGPNARWMNLAWVRSLRDQCRAAGLPVFVKQLGRRPWEDRAHWGAPCKENNLVLKDRHGGDWSEWPVDLRVREFPAVPTKIGA